MPLSSDIKKDRWTEAQILALPRGEHDYFERKAGAVFTDPNNLEKHLAKTVSAFANSGGGHFILGVKDDGTIDGVPRMTGKTTTRESLEQKIPNLLIYPLQDFRVHEVEPSNDSSIPNDKVIIVIDVGDSRLAPHQVASSKVYYHRSGGHSKPAPHFYLETLRRRETYPTNRIVRAWFDTVINPLLYHLKNEKEDLHKKGWAWEGYSKKLNYRLYSLSEPDQPSTKFSDNLDQFLLEYSEMQSALRAHDNAIGKLRFSVGDLFKSIKESFSLRLLYRKTTKYESLMMIAREFPNRISTTGAEEQFVSVFFGSVNEDENVAFLAELIMNEYEELPLNNEPLQLFWFHHRDEFIRILRADSVLENYQKAESYRMEAEMEVFGCTKRLQKIRNDLATKFGEPYDLVETSAQQHYSGFSYPLGR